MKRAEKQINYTKDNTLEKEKLKCDFKELDKEYVHIEKMDDADDYTFRPNRTA